MIDDIPISVKLITTATISKNMPNGNIGMPYFGSITYQSQSSRQNFSEGDEDDYKLSISGSIPGVSMVETHTLSQGKKTVTVRAEFSGTPTSTGSYKISASVRYGSSISKSTSAEVQISGPIKPTIITISLPKYIKGFSYSENIVATGSIPISYTIISGELPPGLMLNSENGQISNIT